ncbi:putative GPI inositol-deacylase PGAP1-like, alpha/beta hydrolase fold protein [Tanacetum coccineum]
MLKVVAYYDLWSWHAMFGVTGSNNDLNVLSYYQLSDDVIDDIALVALFEVRSKLESIDGIVPSTHGECVDVRGASDVIPDLLTEFQVSHTLLSLVDPETGHPISGLRKTLAALTRMLRSGMPGSLSRQLDLHQQSPHLPVRKERKFVDT